jgi:hypothetical protein
VRGGAALASIDEPDPHAVDGGLDAVLDRELAEDRVHVRLDRVLADDEPLRNGAVVRPVGDLAQHLELSLGQVEGPQIVRVP